MGSEFCKLRFSSFAKFVVLFVDVDDNFLEFLVVLDCQHLIFEISFLMFTGSVCLYAPVYLTFWDGSIT